MTGPEITWREGSPKRPRHKAGKIKWPLRPRLAPREQLSDGKLTNPKPKPATCTSVTCAELGAPVLVGRYVCEGCAAKLDARAAELRKRAGT